MLDAISIASFFVLFPLLALYVYGCERLKGARS